MLPLNWFMAELLADDRFLLRAVFLQDGLAVKCNEVASLPNCFWHRLLEVGGISEAVGPWELRHHTLQCMYKSMSYLDCNGFAPLRKYPLLLTVGDVRENLRRLDEYTGDVDDLTADIRLCYRLDPGPARTIEALTLLQHSSGSTGLCEKGHAPISICKRQHPLAEVKILRLLAYAHLQAPFFKLNSADALVFKLEAQLDALMHANPEAKRFTTKMAFLSELHAGCPPSVFQR